jgi:acyl-homoserine-lactone acylase
MKRVRAASTAAATIAVLAAISALASPAALAASPKTPAPGSANGVVSITRDRAGIPHIVATNFKALGYGEAWEFAQDNLCTFANDIVTVEGDRSKYFGPNGTAVNYSAGTSSTNLQSDLYWRYFKATGLAQRELQAKPPNGFLPQVRAVYAGFVAGYNAYLKSGKLNDPTCEGKPWVHPITITDMALRGAQIVTEGSGQQFLSGIVEAAPPAATAPAAAARTATGRAATARTAMARTTMARAASRSLAARSTTAARATFPASAFAALKTQFGDQADRSQGSNGIGLGAQDTRSGHGMVLANPHFPWRGTERFWMAQLDVPGQYDMEGGTLEGFPLIGIGFNRNIAWTHTVSTTRRFLAYQLHLVPGDPTSYYLNGRPTPMGRVTVSVKFGGRTVTHTFYTTHWGVVVNVAAVPGNAYIWNTSTAYALYDVVAPAGFRAANQFFRMGQARSVQGLFNVEAKWLAIPTFNTIAADDHGNAYYGDVGATPAVSQAEINACLPPGVPTLVFQSARVITLDGSRTSCAPANFPGTPQQGIFPASQMPHAIRRDYVENSNDSFWLANPSHPLTGFSPVIGLTGTQQGLRTRIGNQLIAARVAGTDGLGAPRFTLSTLQRMWEGDRSEQAALVLNELVSDCRANPMQTASDGQTVDLTAACNALAGYNGTGLIGAKGGWLFSVWNALDTDSNFYATPFNPAQPLTTPSGLNTGQNPLTPATPLKFLADAVQNLQAHGIALDASYGDAQWAPQSRKIGLPGCDTGCFNAIYSSLGTSTNPVSAAPYGQVYDGSSLVMTTQLNPSGPVSQGILTYSQATDPRSPWYSNMTKLYASRRWVALPYTQAQLKQSHPERTLVLGVR